jgi:hypothetical protein
LELHCESPGKSLNYSNPEETLSPVLSQQGSEPPTPATNLRNTLLVLPSVKRGPGDPSGVLSLKEKRLGLAILESEDFAVATDVQLAL